MKIYIDISVLTLATFVTGIQRAAREIAVRLVREKGDDVILLHYNAKDGCYHRIDNGKFAAYYCDRQGIKERMITRRKVALSEIGRESIFFDLDAAWMGRVKRSYLLPVLKKQGCRITAHIYDIISVTHPQYCLQRGVYNFMDYLGAHLQYADTIIVNAAATADELHKLAAQLDIPLPPCRVVPLGADFGGQSVIKDKEIPSQVVQAAQSGPYILMVGTIEPRKNHKLLLEAYDKGLKELGYHIIMAGYMGWNMEDFEQRLTHHPDYNRGIFHFSGLDDKGIGYLYQHAKFLAFCSYTEGYGLPLIESILRGTPVIAADIPVSREVAGEEYCVWFPQDDADALCRAVRNYGDGEAYEALKKNLGSYHAISWEESYKKMTMPGKTCN